MEEIGVDAGVLGQVLRCHIDWENDDGQPPASVIVKLAGVNAKNRRMSKRLALYQREYDFYRSFAPLVPLRVPKVYFGDFEPKNHRFVLVLEDIRGMEVVDQVHGASPEQAKRAVRALARMHATFWNRTEKPPVSETYDATNPALRGLVQVVYLANLARTLKHFGHAFSNETRRLAEAFGISVVDHMATLAAGPRTFTHGDYRLDNLFFAKDGSDDVAAIDWQVSGRNCGLYDLAYFLVGNLTVDVRRRIERESVEQYHRIVCDAGVTDFTLEECWRWYRRNTLAPLLTNVLVCGGLDLTDDRTRRLAELGLRRSLAAVVDLDVGEFLPDQPRLFATRGMLSNASWIAYRAHKALARMRWPPWD